jgi:Tol biopolymer transport system component
VDFAPSWSPDGTRLAFRRAYPDGSAGVWVIDATGEGARELVRTSRERDALAWSPDGSRIGYASRDGEQLDLFAVDASTGRASKLFESPASEWSPSWVRATGALVFCGDPDGTPSVWLQEAGSEPLLLSGAAAADLAGASPSGRWVTWVDLQGRLVVLDPRTMHARTFDEPREIVSVASWSPDETCVALEAYDWGSSNLYLVHVPSGRPLSLAYTMASEAMPSWHPRDDRLAFALAHGSTVELTLMESFAQPRARVAAPDDVRVLPRPDETRVPPRESLRRVRAGSSSR